MAIPTRRQVLLSMAEEVGLDVEIESRGDKNMHYLFKLDGQEVHQAKGLNDASIWLEGFAAAAQLKATPIKKSGARKKVAEPA